MKKLMGSVVVAAMALSMLTVTAMAGTVKVAVEKTAVAFTDAEPFVDQNSRTLVPLRAIGEAMDVNVEWNEETKTAAFTKYYEEAAELLSDDGATYIGKVTVNFVVGSETATVVCSYFPVGEGNDGEAATEEKSEITMDTAATVKEGRTYAPVKYLAEAFGYTVAWDAETSTVAIDVEEVTTDETTTDETATDETTTDETAAGETAADETATGETTTDETTTDETATEKEAPAYENVPDNKNFYDVEDFYDYL